MIKLIKSKEEYLEYINSGSFGVPGNIKWAKERYAQEQAGEKVYVNYDKTYTIITPYKTIEVDFEFAPDNYPFMLIDDEQSEFSSSLYIVYPQDFINE